jgi:ABC-type transporter Mla subunit MlaD
MKTTPNYFKIGLFVMVAVAILLCGLVMLSAGSFARDTVMMETYIDESVQGLSVGSPVIQRGVQIGTIRQITFVPREYADQLTPDNIVKYNKYIMVIMEIDAVNFRDLPPGQDIETTISQSVDNGLRLKLSPQGITGIYYLEADYMDLKRNPPMTIDWSPKRLYIPSAQSLLLSFAQSTDSILRMLKEVRFNEIADSLDRALNAFTGAIIDAKVAQTQQQISNLIATAKRAIDDAQVARTRSELSELIAKVKETNNLLIEIIGSSETENEKNIRETVTQLYTTLKRVEQLVANQEASVDETMENLRQASENLKETTENVKNYPAQLLFGEPPQRSEVTK